jgi:hypothetical protein
MSVWWVAIVLFGATVSGLFAKWMVLRFLRRVYEKGGPEDLKVAAEALRRVRAWSVLADSDSTRRRGRTG